LPWLIRGWRYIPAAEWEKEMFSRNKGSSRARITHRLLVAAALACVGQAQAEGLSLQAAEAIATRQDPSVEAMESRRQALDEMAVASAQLPDPMVKAGLMSLPTDTWKLDQEPMTQVLIGISQKFPRGKSRKLKSEQFSEQSKALDESAQDMRLRIRLSVRDAYLDVLRQIKLAQVNNEAITAFADLEDITQDYYATGRVQQQDVLRASVERAKAEDRATRIAEEEEHARAQLAAWVGDDAYRQLDSDWPALPAVADQDTIEKGLLNHPRIAALQQQATAADTGVELARQRYKPEFGVDLAYGARSGNNMDGSSRSDLFSVMLVMDLPFFHGNRQDRYVAAAVSQSSAALYDRDDMLRRMASQVRAAASARQRQLERQDRYQKRLLPDARFNADAALSAYQAALENLTTLMRARITEYDLQLDYVRLEADLLKTQALLLYLQGEDQ
jgi:outer membrane protein TolC